MGLLDRPPSSKGKRAKLVASQLFGDPAFVLGLLYIIVILIVAATIAGSMGASKDGVACPPSAPLLGPAATVQPHPQPPTQTTSEPSHQATTRPRPSSRPQQAPSAAYAYRTSALEAHNWGRAQHGSPPLVWNDTLEETAALVSQSCEMTHIMGVLGVDYGQNLAGNNGPFAAFDLAGTIKGSWYDEETL